MEAAARPSFDQVFYREEAPDLTGRLETRYHYRDDSPYAPDADSEDDAGPIGGLCEADGIATAPGEEPSKYCVRVYSPGFVALPGVRFAVGLWVNPELSVSLVYQLHPTIAADTLLGANVLGLEAQQLVFGSPLESVGLSLLGAVFVGRTETPVSVPGYPRIEANALSGPLGATFGAALSHAVVPAVAVSFRSAFTARFPEPQLGLELGVTTEISL